MRHGKRGRGAGGTWPSLVKAPDWGSGEQEFKSPRPDERRFTAKRNVSSRDYGTGMARDSSKTSNWSDTDLTSAVTVSRSWRGVMRELGLCVTSSGSLRVVKRRVALLELDTSHFTGQRTWSDAALKRAAVQAHSWDELLAAIGITSGSGDERTRVKAHALRLGLDLSHLADQPQESRFRPSAMPTLSNLREAATSLAASWFSLCGFNPAIPMEPTIYDLLVSMPDGIKRVQVKTTTYNSKNGWMIQVGRRPYSIGNNARLVPYDPELIDLFFIADGDLSLYLIPSKVIAGRVGLLLRTYANYIVGNAAGLMTPRPGAA